MHFRSVAAAILGLATVALPAAFAEENIIHARMTVPGIMKTFANGSQLRYQLPRTYVFDAEGRQVLQLTGYGPGTVSTIAEAAVRVAPAEAPRLSDFLPLLTREDGKPLTAADIPANTPVIAELGAEWCAPCRYLRPALAKLAASSTPRVIVLDIDADMRRVSRDKMREAEKKAPQ